MGKIFAVANQKGGVGKTTLTLNIAGAYCYDDPEIRVAVIDADSQNTSVRSSGVGEKPYPFTVVSLAAAGDKLGREIKRLAADYDLVLVDCPPTIDNPATENVIRVADFVLVPLDASPADAWSTSGMLQLVRRAIPGADSTRCGILFNRVNKKTVAFAEVSEAMSAGGRFNVLKSTVAQREIYKTCMGTGTTVFNVKGQRGAKPARDEIGAVAQEMLVLMGLMENTENVQ